MTQIITQHLFLTGFMGSGKSTIGKNLAKRLNLAFIDTDHRIEKSLGVEIKDIFREKGEDWFRAYEGDILGILARTESPSVISLGGGTLMNPQSVKTVLELGILIYIKSSPAEIWKRIRHSTRRPLMRKDGEEWTREEYLERITALMALRETGYAASNLTIDRDGKEVAEITEMIIQRLNLSA